MNHQRLHGLSDGVFAIAATLLALDIHVPVLAVASTHNLLVALRVMLPILLSLVLSFAILYTFWQGHTFVISHLAKNINATLSNINAVFLFFVVLIPFSSEFLGLYHNSEIGILLYGMNVIAISTALLWMSKYIIRSGAIQSSSEAAKELRAVYIRASFPSVCALLAIIIGVFNKDIPILLFTIGVLFNFTSSSTRIINKLLMQS